MEDQSQKHEVEVKSLQQRHKASMEAKEKQYEGRITAAISEKKTEEKLHQQTKLEANQAKEKLLNELYYEKRAKNDLEDELEARNKDIR